MIDYTEIYHHGVKGQKWGVRRYQKKNGSRTPLGKKHQKTLNREAEKKQLDEDTIASLKTRLLKGRRADSGELDARTLYKYRTKFTTKEIKEFNDRLATERALGGYASSQRTKGEKFVFGLKTMAVNALKEAANSAMKEYAKQFVNDALGRLSDEKKDDNNNNNNNNGGGKKQKGN